MTYFADLAPYRYGVVPMSWNQDGPPSLEPTELYWWMWGTHYGAFELPELAVGWLEPPHEFPRGELAMHLIEKLDNLCRTSNYHVTRGFYPCGICGNSADGLGSKEIRILGNWVVYAAPNKIAHYVMAHAYAPPQDFITALEQCEGIANPNRDVHRPITLDMIPRESIDITRLDSAIREDLRRGYREQIFNELSLQDCGDVVSVSTRINFRDNSEPIARLWDVPKKRCQAALAASSRCSPQHANEFFWGYGEKPGRSTNASAKQPSRSEVSKMLFVRSLSC